MLPILPTLLLSARATMPPERIEAHVVASELRHPACAIAASAINLLLEDQSAFKCQDPDWGEIECED